MYTIKHINIYTLIEFTKKYKTKNEAIEAINKHWNKLKTHAKYFHAEYFNKMTENKIITKQTEGCTKQIIFKNNEILEQSFVCFDIYKSKDKDNRIFIDDETNKRTNELMILYSHKSTSPRILESKYEFEVKSLQIFATNGREYVKAFINIPDNIKNISEYLKRYVKTEKGWTPTKVEWEEVFPEPLTKTTSIYI